MTRPQNRFFIVLAILLLVLGIALFSFLTRDQEPVQTFPATVSRDCAPWDGAAFTITVMYNLATPLYISIWQAPDIQSSATFSFPDESGQVGNAYLIAELGPYTELSGEVSFERVEEGRPIEGQFRFMSERGDEFVGTFVAQWDDRVVMCG